MIEQSIIDSAKAVNLVELVQAKGIKVKKQGNQYFALCPFHNDTNPSLAIDTKTNLFKCFSCGASGDAIRFVELYGKLGFPEAVQALTGSVQNQGLATVNLQQVLNKVTQLYHEAFCKSAKAQNYLASRGINRPEKYMMFKPGYTDGKLLAPLIKKGTPMFQTLKESGILTKTDRELFAGCVVFPLLDANGNTVGMYGRKIEPKNNIIHLYLPGKRQGIFNRPAAATSTELILTESILDALSLYQNGFTNAIPIYGTNGLTEDHLELFHTYRPKKIHLCFDNDDPGQEAVIKVGQALNEKGFNVNILQLPQEYKDVNDFFCGGKTRAEFKQVLEAGKELAFALNGHSVEETEYGLLLSSQDRQYRIRGISLHSLERLKVNIRATCGDRYHIDTLDLYQSKARKYFTSQLAKLFSVDAATIDADLLFLIDEIEKYQAKQLNQEQKPKEPYKMTKEEEQEAIGMLQSPDLCGHILSDMEALGHVGEETNKILAYLIAVSRKLPRPLSGIVISGSGAGKSGLVELVQELTPPEEVEFFSRITPQALYYMERDAIKRKLIIIEERTGGEGADYSIRTLQSKQKLTQAVPLKDPNTGTIRTMTFEVEGPIAYLETTTNAEINHENATRCFELYLDESIEQTRRIHDAQRKAKTIDGLSRKLTAEAIKARQQNMQRMLKTVMVEIPYAPMLDFPADSLRTRRDHERFLSLIEAVTFLHQYQREQKEITNKAGEPVTCVLSSIDDYTKAYELARDVLGFSLDDLKKHARELLELIQALVDKLFKETGQIPEEISFTRRDIREFTGWPDHQIKAHIKQLEEMEYLLLETGKNRCMMYRLNNPDVRKPLKGLLKPEELREHLTVKAQASGRSGRNGSSTT